MTCDHERQYWKPVEGTIHCAIRFAREPEKFGFCVVCRAVEEEREACAIVAESERPNGSLADVLMVHGRAIAEKIRARG